MYADMRGGRKYEDALYKLKRFNRPSGMDSRSFFSKIQGK